MSSGFVSLAGKGQEHKSTTLMQTKFAYEALQAGIIKALVLTS